MTKNTYVINHDYGYGKETRELNKLSLRNLDDLVTYIQDVCNSSLVDFEIKNDFEILIPQNSAQLIIQCL